MLNYEDIIHKSIDTYYIWYNFVWVLSCLSPNFTILALPIHGYSRYSTKEILLAYAYILMAYLSIIICYLSFLYEEHSSLVDREADRSSIDVLSSRNDVRMLPEDNANANSVHNQSSNQELN